MFGASSISQLCFIRFIMGLWTSNFHQSSIHRHTLVDMITSWTTIFLMHLLTPTNFLSTHALSRSGTSYQQLLYPLHQLQPPRKPPCLPSESCGRLLVVVISCKPNQVFSAPLFFSPVLFSSLDLSIVLIYAQIGSDATPAPDPSIASFELQKDYRTKNHEPEMFSNRVKELFEPIVLRKKGDGFCSFQKHFLRNRSLSNAGWFYGKKKGKIGKGNLYLTENRLRRNEMWCAADNHNYMCHMCGQGF